MINFDEVKNKAKVLASNNTCKHLRLLFGSIINRSKNDHQILQCRQFTIARGYVS